MLQMAFDPLFFSAQKDCWKWSLSMGESLWLQQWSNYIISLHVGNTEIWKPHIGRYWQVEAKESRKCASLSGKVWGWLVIGDWVNDGGGVKAEEVRGRKPVGRKYSAGFRREDASDWPGKSAERVNLRRCGFGMWQERTWDTVNAKSAKVKGSRMERKGEREQRN